MEYWQDALNEVNVAQWLKSQDFMAAEVCEVPQPVVGAGRPVTFWKHIDGRPGSRSDIATLGVVLRRLHSMPRPSDFALPDEVILGRVGARIEVAPVPDDDKRYLYSRLEELDASVSSIRFPLAPAPTHGDAHSENLMIRDGQPVLIDFERFAWGQPEWDLAMTATEFATAGWWTREEYAQFVDAYGYDVMQWREGFDVLRAVHEIKMTTWLMQNVKVSEDIADEYRVRMKTIREGYRTEWRPF